MILQSDSAWGGSLDIRHAGAVRDRRLNPTRLFALEAVLGVTESKLVHHPIQRQWIFTQLYHR